MRGCEQINSIHGQTDDTQSRKPAEGDLGKVDPKPPSAIEGTANISGKPFAHLSVARRVFHLQACTPLHLQKRA